MNTIMSLATVDLDAIGKQVALMAQIAALEPIARAPSGATAEFIRNGERVRMTPDQALATVEGLMAERRQHRADMDRVTQHALSECVDFVWQMYAAPALPFTGTWADPATHDRAVTRQVYEAA
jgi:hypothetical protein